MAENPQYSPDDELDTLVSIKSPNLLFLSLCVSRPFFCVTLQIRQEKPYYSPNPELDSLVSMRLFYVVLHLRQAIVLDVYVQFVMYVFDIYYENEIIFGAEFTVEHKTARRFTKSADKFGWH